MTPLYHSRKGRQAAKEFLLTQGFTAALVWAKLVALLAPALEASLTVSATLAAIAFLCTLIHIWKQEKWREWSR